jgi:hypothetical protein
LICCTTIGGSKNGRDQNLGRNQPETRRFFGTAAIAVAATQFGMIGSAAAAVVERAQTVREPVK